jgi:hypothetical protein
MILYIYIYIYIYIYTAVDPRQQISSRAGAGASAPGPGAAESPVRVGPHARVSFRTAASRAPGPPTRSRPSESARGMRCGRFPRAAQAFIGCSGAARTQHGPIQRPGPTRMHELGSTRIDSDRLGATRSDAERLGATRSDSDRLGATRSDADRVRAWRGTGRGPRPG